MSDLPDLTPEDLAEMRLVANVAASAGFTRIQINPKHSIALIDALNRARAELAAVYDAAFEAGEVEAKPAVDKVRAIIDSRNDLCERLDIINGAYETECERSDRYRKALVFIRHALARYDPDMREIGEAIREALL